MVVKIPTYIFQDIPEYLQDKDVLDGVVYVCENDKMIQLSCPCGCGTKFKLTMIPSSTGGGWKIIRPDTIVPSINYTIGCLSHFKITKGKVEF